MNAPPADTRPQTTPIARPIATSAGVPGRRASGSGLPAEQDLGRAGVHDHREGQRERALRHPARERRGQQRADHHRRPHAAHQRPVDAAEAMVRAHAGAGGEHDRRHAGAEREVHRVVRGELLRREHRREHRHQRHAAADAEQPGEKTDEGAGREVGEHPGRDHRPSIAAGNRETPAAGTYVPSDISPWEIAAKNNGSISRPHEPTACPSPAQHLQQGAPLLSLPGRVADRLQRPGAGQVHRHGLDHVDRAIGPVRPPAAGVQAGDRHRRARGGARHRTGARQRAAAATPTWCSCTTRPPRRSSWPRASA